MNRPAPSQREVARGPVSGLAAVIVAILCVLSAIPTAAQTFSVIHNFTGNDGYRPDSGVILDRGGTIYGATAFGGNQRCGSGHDPGSGGGGPAGCGVVFRLKKQGNSWVETPLWDFTGINGSYTTTPGELTIGPNGSLYGPELLGGNEEGGRVYNLRPGSSAPSSVIAPWNYAPVWDFCNGNDACYPNKVVFDAAGNMYGSSTYGGNSNLGAVWEMTPAGNGTWNESVIYGFLGPLYGDGDRGHGVALDEQGNIYGTTYYGGNTECFDNYGCGVVYELTHTSSGWTETILHVFQQNSEGGAPGPLMRDSAGNLYGATSTGAVSNNGTVWKLSPSGGGNWTLTILYTFPYQTVDDGGPYRLVMDSAGVLYGINNWGGANNLGNVFKLVPGSNGNWTYVDLHDFGSMTGNADGCLGKGPVAVDGSGNIYGVAEECGSIDGGTAWEITPQ